MEKRIAMANNCAYNIVAVGKTKESVERVEKILRYEDEEFFLNRVFSVFVVEDPSEKEGLWTIQLCGDTAWSAEPWANDFPDHDRRSKKGAHYSTLTEICRSLDIGIEVFAEEEAIGVQEHYVVNHIGVFTEKKEFRNLALVTEGDMCGLAGGIEDFCVWEDEKKVYGLT